MSYFLISSDPWVQLTTIEVFLRQIKKFMVTAANHNQKVKLTRYGIELGRLLEKGVSSRFELIPYLSQCYLLPLDELLVIRTKDVQTPMVLKTLFRVNAKRVDCLKCGKLCYFVFFDLRNRSRMFRDYLHICISGLYFFKSRGEIWFCSFFRTAGRQGRLQRGNLRVRARLETAVSSLVNNI